MSPNAWDGSLQFDAKSVRVCSAGVGWRSDSPVAHTRVAAPSRGRRRRREDFDYLLRGLKLRAPGHQSGGRDRARTRRRAGVDPRRQRDLRRGRRRPHGLFEVRRRPLPRRRRGDLRAEGVTLHRSANGAAACLNPRLPTTRAAAFAACRDRSGRGRARPAPRGTRSRGRRSVREPSRATS